MNKKIRDIGRVFAAAAERWDDVEGFRLGAAFSFYATFAIFPLLLLTVTALGFVVGDEDPARGHVLDAFAAQGTPIRHVLESTIGTMQQSRSSRGWSAAIGIATLLFSASGAFVELDAALNRIWSKHVKKSAGLWGGVRAWVRDRLVGVVIVGAIGLTSVASLAVNAALGAILDHAPKSVAPAFLRAAEACASVTLLSFVFAAALHWVPRTRPRFRDVIGGAVLTATLLTILKTLFAGYLAGLTSYSAYGIAGGVLAVAMWIYLSSQLIFFGACITRAACGSCEEDEEDESGRAARHGSHRGSAHDVGLEA